MQYHMKPSSLSCLLPTGHWPLPKVPTISISKPRQLSCPSGSLSLTLGRSLPFLHTRRGLDKTPLMSLQPKLSICFFLTRCGSTKVENSRWLPGHPPQEGWGMAEHLEPGLGPFLHLLASRGCGPGVGREKGTGRGLQPLVVL